MTGDQLAGVALVGVCGWVVTLCVCERACDSALAVVVAAGGGDGGGVCRCDVESHRSVVVRSRPHQSCKYTSDYTTKTQKKDKRNAWEENGERDEEKGTVGEGIG